MGPKRIVRQSWSWPRRRQLGMVVASLAALVTFVACSTDNSREAANQQSSPSSSTPPAATPAGGEPRVQITARVNRGGSVTVTEDITFASPIQDLTLSTRQLDEVDAPNYRPRLIRLHVSSPVEPVRRIEGLSSLRQISLLPSRQVHLVYQLTGVTQTSSTLATRYLLYLPALQVSDTQRLQTQIKVLGALNLGCAMPGGSIQPCGHSDGRGWSVVLAPGEGQQSIFAQVDSA